MALSKSQSQRAPRRRWPLAEKRRIVELTLREDASIRAIAHEYSVHPTSLCHWKSLYRAGKLNASAPRSSRVSGATLLPVTIMPAAHAPRGESNSSVRARSIVQIVLPSGATLRIETGVLDPAIVCALITQLR